MPLPLNSLLKNIQPLHVVCPERLEIETAGSVGPELVVMGAEDADAFKLAVLKAREEDRGFGGASTSAVVTVRYRVLQRAIYRDLMGVGPTSRGEQTVEGIGMGWACSIFGWADTCPACRYA
jgi:hypothetical protein